MRVELKEGKLEIDAVDLLEHMSATDHMQLIQSLACMDTVIKHVADQIIGGWTEGGYHGARCSPSADPSTALDAAIRQVAEASGDTAKREISALSDQLRRLDQRLTDLSVENSNLRDRLYNLGVSA